jgi:hypothetical protein
MESEFEFKKGDEVRVSTHSISTGGVTILVDGFAGEYMSEGVGGDGQRYITVYRTDQYAGYRTVDAKHVFPAGVVPRNEQTTAVDYQMVGKKCIIRCADCKTPREILPSNLHNVKRCRDCQKKYLKNRARERRQGKKRKE